MTLKEAKAIIDTSKRTGYCVSFEENDDRLLRGGIFPDPRTGEEALETEDIAWELAREFAAADKRYVNVYVIHANGFTPVSGYESKIFNPYP